MVKTRHHPCETKPLLLVFKNCIGTDIVRRGNGDCMPNNVTYFSFSLKVHLALSSLGFVAYPSLWALGGFESIQIHFCNLHIDEDGHNA